MKIDHRLLAGLLAISAAAAVLAQPPATTLLAPSSAETAPAPDGFIQRWLILEPIATNGLNDAAVQTAVKKDYFPNQFTVVPHDGDKVTVGGAPLTWHAEETKLYNVNLFHFARALGKPTTNVLFWAVTVVIAPEDMPA